MTKKICGLPNKSGSKINLVNSLVHLQTLDTGQPINYLEPSSRRLDDGVHPLGSGRRRSLLLEGQSILRYLLKTKPPMAVLKRYVRAVEAKTNGQSLNLPRLFLYKPLALALITPFTLNNIKKWQAFEWRLNAATRLAEASPENAKRFLGSRDKVTKYSSFFKIIISIIGEILLRILGLIFFKFLRFFLKPMKNGRTSSSK